MNDSYTRHICGIKPVEPTWRSKTFDAMLLTAGLALMCWKIKMLADLVLNSG